MGTRLHSLVWSCLVSSSVLGTLVLDDAPAAAQDNPELGDVRHVEVRRNPPPRAADTRVVVRDTRADGPFDRDVALDGTDHASVVGHFGVGWFGIFDLPIAGATEAGADFNGTVTAPAIGARYWLSERLGIEGALGIGVTSGGVTTQVGNVSTTVDSPSVFGLALHGGLPLVFATTSHFAFQLVPELNFGFTSGGFETAGGDVDVSGILLQVGARVGAEIQFGFIGIPQLSLQGTVGLHLSYQGRSASFGENNEVSSSSFRFGTTVQDEPWDIFAGNIAAIYYF
ncbi:MAG: hypothetical protein ABW321_18495 [Polyangiales bacterium]